MHASPRFFQHWDVFSRVAPVLAGGSPEFELLRPPLAAEVMVAVEIARKIDETPPWQAEVERFIGAVFLHEGLLYAPPPCEMAVLVDVEQYAGDAKFLAEKWPEVRASKKPLGGPVERQQFERLLLLQQHLDEDRARLRAQQGFLHELRS